MSNLNIYSTIFICAFVITTSACQSAPITYKYSESLEFNKLSKEVIFDIKASHSDQCKFVTLALKNIRSENTIKVKNIPTITHNYERDIFVQQLPAGSYELLSGKCTNTPLTSGNQPETSLIGMKYWIKGLEVAGHTRIVYPGTLIIGPSKLSDDQKERINQKYVSNITTGERLPLNRLPVFENYEIEDNRRAIALVIDQLNEDEIPPQSDASSKYIYSDFANLILAEIE